MNEILVSLISGGTFGALAGSIASLLAPWANWKIEEKRFVCEERRNLIMSWRGGINDIEPDRAFSNVNTSEWYGTLRKHLQPDVIQRLEGMELIELGTSPKIGPPRCWWQMLVLSEIERLEKQWGLV
ncbi:MAG: hypothetical protein GXX79_03610 [Actinomycetales bacterium]|nr:hypothetical protein [Actinomycetales bacterium]